MDREAFENMKLIKFINPLFWLGVLLFFISDSISSGLEFVEELRYRRRVKEYEDKIRGE
jgi:hypothetical protein